MKKRIIKWWKARNEAYTHLCNEEFSNGQVVLTHTAIIVIILACGLAEWIGGQPW